MCLRWAARIGASPNGSTSPEVAATSATSVQARPQQPAAGARSSESRCRSAAGSTSWKALGRASTCHDAADCSDARGCAGSSERSAPTSTPEATSAPTVSAGTQTSSSDAAIENAETDVDFGTIRDELIAMRDADQAERAEFGDPDAGPWHDKERTARLIEIIDSYGWPTPEMVGEEASTAAWLIVQHSDADPAFQQRVLAALTNEVEDYTGKAGQVALLTDRVATNTGQLQRYGSQVGCADVTPIPRPELERPDDVDALRAAAELEPLAVYLARFEQHCADLARLPIEAGCARIDGIDGLFEPNTAILIGELHGTEQSPQFVDAVTCTAASYGYEIVVGLEIPTNESKAIAQYLTSDGGAEATAELLAEPFWSSPYPDGRQSNAMLQLLDSIRQRKQQGATIDVVLLDATTPTDRDHTMAHHLTVALENTPDGIAIALTGNIHNRRVRGTDFDRNYEPMGYLVSQRLGDRSVVALDVRYTGGAAWGCAQDQTCGPRTFNGNSTSEPDSGTFTIEFHDQLSADGFDGTYGVGELAPSAPAAASD